MPIPKTRSSIFPVMMNCPTTSPPKPTPSIRPSSPPFLRHSFYFIFLYLILNLDRYFYPQATPHFLNPSLHCSYARRLRRSPESCGIYSPDTFEKRTSRR